MSNRTCSYNSDVDTGEMEALLKSAIYQAVKLAWRTDLSAHVIEQQVLAALSHKGSGK